MLNLRELRSSPAPGEPDLRGILHDVGHGLLTLSLLLNTIDDADRGRLGGELFELLDTEVARLLAAVHSGVRSSRAPVEVELGRLLRPFAAVAGRTTPTAVAVHATSGLMVHADPASLWRVVTNLLDNAVRAAGPHGKVSIGAESAGPGLVRIDVVDDGPGFRRGPGGRARIGLAVVRALLAECGGRLEIGPVRPRGTRARVLLPAHAGRERAG